MGEITRTDVGSEAEGEVVFDLRQDGVWTSAVSDSAAFVPFVDGIWGTTGLNWVGTGRTVEGVQLNFSAPREETRLHGAWSAGRDINGRFDVRKQTSSLSCRHDNTC